MNVEALFGIGRILVRGVKIAGSLILDFVRKLDSPQLRKILTSVVIASSRAILRKANELSDEEGELGRKYRRDGKHTETDRARAQEIAEERERLREEFESAKAKEATETAQSLDVVAPVTPDEVSAVTGIITFRKNCPDCGSQMRICQSGNKHGYSPDTNGRRFWWKCTMHHSCHTIPFDPGEHAAKIVRAENPDLDGSAEGRRQIWTNDATLLKTHTRIRAHLGEIDEEVVCPKHLLPMKLLQSRRGTGKLLDNYEYVCLAVGADGRACNYSVAIETFPQVAEALRRYEGAGIIDSK